MNQTMKSVNYNAVKTITDEIRDVKRLMTESSQNMSHIVTQNSQDTNQLVKREGLKVIPNIEKQILDMHEAMSSNDDRRVDMFHISTIDIDTNILENLSTKKMDTMDTINRSMGTVNQAIDNVGNSVNWINQTVSDISKRNDEILGLEKVTGRNVFGLVDKFEVATKNDNEWKNQLMLNEE
jgi:uncharacterized protein YoxC